jgi:hypothetical protein
VRTVEFETSKLCFLYSKNESVDKFGKKSKLTEIFEYTVKTTFASKISKVNIFQKFLLEIWPFPGIKKIFPVLVAILDSPAIFDF